jgi:Leucine-rich repeat (LRR) protein
LSKSSSFSPNYIHNIHPQAFCNINHLRTLAITNEPRLDIINLKTALDNMKKDKLKVVHFNYNRWGTLPKDMFHSFGSSRIRYIYLISNQLKANSSINSKSVKSFNHIIFKMCRLAKILLLNWRIGIPFNLIIWSFGRQLNLYLQRNSFLNVNATLVHTILSPLVNLQVLNLASSQLIDLPLNLFPQMKNLRTLDIVLILSRW